MTASDEAPAATPPPQEPGALVLVIGAPIDRAGLPGLCERVLVLLEGSSAQEVVYDVGALADPDAVVVDALARLTLTARRLGRHIRLSNASEGLEDLLGFAGLCGAVGLERALRFESRGQTEEWKHAGGIEEEHDPGDPAV